jgi:hypothetical protein
MLISAFGAGHHSNMMRRLRSVRNQGVLSTRQKKVNGGRPVKSL